MSEKLTRLLPVVAVFASFVFFVRGAYARELPPFTLGMSTQVVSTDFELSPKVDPGTALNYRPAQSNYVGIIMGYRWLGGTLSFGVPADSQIRAREGTSKFADYRLSYYDRGFGIETSYNLYKSYLIDNSSTLSAATLGGESFYKLPQLRTLGYGLNFIYVMDSSSYSLPAALSRSEIQEKSGGSWILLASLRDQSIIDTSPMIPTEKQAAFGSEATIRTIHTFNSAVGGGYAYNWVPGIFFVAPFLAATVGYHHVSYELQDSAPVFSRAGLNFHARLGIGVNVRHFFLSVSLAADIYGIETQTLRVSNNVQAATFAIGARF